MANPQIQVNRLAETVGDFIQYWGFKKIHGMIWTHLFLSPTPLTASDLISKLKISKALVSLTIKDLVLYEVVFESHEPGNNKNKIYIANPNPYEAILRVLQTREKPMLTRIQTEFDFLKRELAKSETKTIEHDRVKKMGGMIKGASLALHGLLSFSKIDPASIFGKNTDK